MSDWIENCLNSLKREFEPSFEFGRDYGVKGQYDLCDLHCRCREIILANYFVND